MEPTWQPRALERWTEPGGPLHGTGTLDELCDPPDRANSPGGLRALVDDQHELDGAAQGRDVRRWAQHLEQAGATVGDVVAWQLPNVADSVLLYRACWRLGAVAAPLHPLAGEAAISAAVDDLAPRILLTADGEETFERPGPGVGSKGQPSASDVAVVIHTSGFSGKPKGVMHTHGSLAYKARSMVGVHGLTSADAVLMPAPLAHVSGLLNGILVPSAASMTTVLMQKWDPARALDLIAAHRITFMVGPPTFFIGLEHADGFSAERVRSLRLLSIGGAGVTPEFVEHTSEVFGAEVKRSYGSSEAPTVTSARPDDDAWTRAHTDGRPTGVVAIRTAEPTSGSSTAAGEPGEVQLCGPELFSGYTDATLNDAATTSDSTGDWFRTGDIGLIDDKGRLTITGRLGNVIIRGGENIDAAEVEAHLVAHPAVLNAVVLGEPDERLGERVLAVVELSASDDDPEFSVATCADWFTRRGATRFMTPERIVVVDSMPLLGSGKADRIGVARRVGLAG
ncbi:MAG: cyclohexanecarboxylate-CoA ligase [Actinomycetia bacterium]|nr:cyclohexanecarboxylate-CoA ligase [Actinomycetes bacterium]